MKRLAATAGALCVALAPFAANAFKLQALGMVERSPLGDATRQAKGYLSLFDSDIHERITRQAYEKAGARLTDDVIAGVRWNDNPPVMRMGPLAGTCDMQCWISMLRVDRLAVEILSKREQSIPAFRSHFGDMQFLHAMAAREGEPASETRDKALRWAEFSYRVARGEVGPRANIFALRDSQSTLEAGTREWVSSVFRAPGKQLWRVQDLFLPGSGDLRRVAFGTLLHLVEDSYSASHVQRVAARHQPNGCPSYDAADPILAFHTYAGQDSEKHALCDDAPDWLGAPREASPLDVIAQLVRAYDEGRDWGFVKAILEEKVFRLAPGARAAGTGRCFEARLDLATEASAPRPVALEPGCRESPL